jgi:hypothetical protein
MNSRALLALLLFTAAAPSRRVAVVTRVAAAPDVDGVLEEWSPGLFAVSPPASLGSGTSVIEEGVIDGDGDHSAEVWLTTSPGRLHLAAQVTDDLIEAQDVASELYRDDGLEVLLARPDGGLWHLGVNANGRAFLFDPPAGPLRGVEVAVRRAPPGYFLEATIPLGAFGASDATLDGWRLNLAARDVDRGVAAHRVWSGLAHTQRASLGQLTVVRSAPAPAPSPPCPAPARVVTLNEPLSVRREQLVAADAGVTLRLVNYQPARAPWARQWTAFDARQAAVDFERTAKVGANAVRVFVFYGPFGEHAVKPEALQRLRTVVGLAASAGLVVVVSFFPFDKEFRPTAWPGMAKHLETIVGAFVGEPAIAMWELMNEPDHAWALPDAGVTAREVSAWASHMAQVVRRADPSHLVTVGLAGHFARPGDGGVDADQALPFVDAVAVHGYFDDVPLGPFLERAKRLGKPVVLQEYGRSRLFWTAQEAARFDEGVCRAARAAGLAGVGAWELYDHPVGSIDWLERPWREAPENWFGLLSPDGVPHPRAAVFCRCLEAPAFKVRPVRP